MVTIFWAVTPLQSAVFTTSTIHRTIATDINTTAKLEPLSSQASGLTHAFMLAAYQTLWLGQELPGFTSMAGAVLPFASIALQHHSLANETLTATTSFYSTSLTCEPAIIDNTGGGYFTFDNRRGCHAGPVGFSDDHFTALYLGDDDPNTDWGLPNAGCPNISHEYLAIWGKVSVEKDTNNITALFCRPNYFVQSVNATVAVPKMTVSSITPLSLPTPLTEEVFNISTFEYIISTGSLPFFRQGDATEKLFLEQWPRLRHMNLSLPTTNMVGFAVGASKLPPAAYMNADILSSSFESAHKLLFALAINGLLTTNISSFDIRSGAIEGTVEAVTVVRTFAILVEAFLGLIAALAVALLYVSWSRRSQLWYDPASIKDTMNVVARDSVLLKSFGMSGDNDDAEVSAELHQQHRYHLYDGHCSTKLTGPPGNNCSVKSLSMSAQVKDDMVRGSVRPVELSFTVGAALLTVLFPVTAILAVLQIMTTKLNGALQEY